MKKFAFFLVLAIALLGCKVQTKLMSDEFLYRQAIQNSIYPTAGKVSDKLVPITKDNPNLIWKTISGEDYVLVVSWKQNIAFYKTYLDSAFYNTGKYPIWITTAPELKQRMKKEKIDTANRRLIQLLGLPPNSVYSYFVEFWVKPADLFRPCPDKEITDARCETCFPDQPEADHVSWMNENRISRYYQCELYNQYPWTQLGYTYDWNPKNKSHVGLSEFVIGPGKKIVVKAIYPTNEYLNLK
jgi:hypothetical protein